MEDETELKNSVIRARKIAKAKGYPTSKDVEGDYALGDKALCQKYAVGDTQRVMQLYNFCDKHFTDKHWELFNMEMELMNVLLSMENFGVKIDKERVEEIKVYYNDIVVKAEETKALLGYADLNTRSPKQMKEVFYDKLGASPEYKRSKDSKGNRTKKLTTDKNALKKWAVDFPLAASIVDIKTSQHELSSFIEPMDKLSASDGRVHPNYNQAATITGRLSCSAPNLQNISNVKEAVKGRVKLRARELFVPEKDHVLYFPDYSQIEVWVSAYLSQDPVMCGALAGGLDMHGSFNDKFFGERPDYVDKKESYRKQVKIGTFTTIYGGGVDAIVDALGCPKTVAADFLAYFRERYCVLHQYGKLLESVANEHGWVENPFGRIYLNRGDVAYKMLNYMVQGSAAEVMKRALINVYNLTQLPEWEGAKLLLTIHDELCIEVPNRLHSKKFMREVIKAMQGDFHTYFGMPRPFDVSMAWTPTRWSEKQEIDL